MALRTEALDLIQAKNINIDSVYDLWIFVHIADAGSLSAAARDLNLSLAFVSKRLQRLESALQVRLMNRTTRHLALTSEGRLFLDQCRIILAEVRKAEEIVLQGKEEISGILTLTSSVSLSRRHVVPQITKFQAHYPAAKFRLIATDDLVDIVSEGVDVAIRQAPLVDSSLMTRALACDRRILCASPSYIERFGVPLQPRALSEHRCIVFGNPPMANWILTNGQTTEEI